MEGKITVMGEEESFILSTMHAMWKNRCLSLIVGLKIPELLCSAEEPSLSIEDIAKKSGCTSSKGLYPVMKVLAQWGIGKELENKHFAKNRGMEVLRRDKQPGLGHFFNYFCSDEHFSAMRSLPACVKHGQPAFLLEHNMTHFQYMGDTENHLYDKTKMFEGSSGYLVGSDERRREFVENYLSSNAHTTHLTTLQDVNEVNNVFQAFQWSTSNTLVDMGGCSSEFLTAIMKLPGCEHIHGYVLDLPDVIDKALQKGVHFHGDLKDRIKFIKHDFTLPFPSDRQLQADTVMFKNVLSAFIHDHELMAKILLNCRNLFPSQGGRLLIIDFVAVDVGSEDNLVGINGLEYGALSIHWLSISGNPILSRAEWIKTLQEIGIKTGYQLKQVYNTFSGGSTIFELSYTTV